MLLRKERLINPICLQVLKYIHYFHLYRLLADVASWCDGDCKYHTYVYYPASLLPHTPSPPPQPHLPPSLCPLLLPPYNSLCPLLHPSEWATKQTGQDKDRKDCVWQASEWATEQTGQDNKNRKGCVWPASE